jgi:hypothetical protein
MDDFVFFPNCEDIDMAVSFCCHHLDDLSANDLSRNPLILPTISAIMYLANQPWNQLARSQKMKIMFPGLQQPMVLKMVEWMFKY